MGLTRLSEYDAPLGSSSLIVNFRFARLIVGTPDINQEYLVSFSFIHIMMFGSHSLYGIGHRDHRHQPHRHRRVRIHALRDRQRHTSIIRLTYLQLQPVWMASSL
jgi:hypothetical protein